MTELPHSLDREVHICAQRATVFRFFTDSTRFARWWGPGSTIDAKPGGAVKICYPNGVVVTGEVVEVVAGEKIVFTYGYQGERPMIVPGGSRVSITLADHGASTLLRLRHDFPDVAARDAHAPGWRYQLAVFANVVSDEQQAGAAAIVDRFFASWSEKDPTARGGALADITLPSVTFRDKFAAVAGREEFSAHIGAAQIHAPAGNVKRDGDVRQCQGTAVVDWVAHSADGSEFARGTNVFEFAGDGRIAAAVGLWR